MENTRKGDHIDEYLQGQIERITYVNEDNGYTVAKVQVQGQRELVTVIGNIVSPLPGQVLQMRGEWQNHPQYGPQFKINYCNCKTPANASGIQKYLASSLIKGVGPVMAKRIVKRFGEDTIQILDQSPDKLVEVEGIGYKRIEMIKQAWQEQKEIREVMLFLQAHGVSTTYAVKIFKTYGNDSIQVVQENPYRLATDIFGIGFVTADQIAEKLGFEKESELRARAGVLYVLNQTSEEGHVYYPYDLLVQKCMDMLDIREQIIVDAIDTVVTENRVVIEDIAPDDDKSNTHRAVFLTGFYYAEQSIANKLNRFINTFKSLRQVDTQKAIKWVQEKYSMQLAAKQVQAVTSALREKILVITGGPGTGKSFLLNAILRIVSVLGARVVLTAPTGRAAKRMNESTGYTAKTIHRLLEFDFQKGSFKKNEQNPLECDLLVVDEASMVDTVLMHHLLKAVPDEATLIIVGDVYQLPSVGAGNVLKDMIESGKIPVIQLNEIFRQARDSSIVLNAHRINAGEFPNLSAREDKLDDFYFVPQEDPELVLDKIKYLCRERIPKRFGLDPVKDVQILSPMNKGVVGVNYLNQEMQKYLNPQSKELSRGGRVFRVADKVMQIKNNYEKEIYNGDIGKIVDIEEQDREVLIEFDGKRIIYDYSELDELVHAYAVSIHKSQGSDFPAVIIPVLTQHYMMLQRNLIYTAITRGRKLVVLIGTKKALAMAIKNAQTQKRYTYLKERIMHTV